MRRPNAAMRHMRQRPNGTIEMGHPIDDYVYTLEAGEDDLWYTVFDQKLKRYLQDARLAAEGEPVRRVVYVSATVVAKAASLHLPLPGDVYAHVHVDAEPRVGRHPHPNDLYAGASVILVVDWKEAARNLFDTLGVDAEEWEVEEFAERLEDSPPARDLRAPWGAKQWEYGMDRHYGSERTLSLGYDPEVYLQDYLWRVEDQFIERVETAAEQLYEWAREALTGRPIEAAELAVAGEYAETPLVMNAMHMRHRQNPDPYAEQAALYQWFIVEDGQVTSGWEYREDAQEAAEEAKERSSSVKIVAKSRLARMGLSPV